MAHSVPCCDQQDHRHEATGKADGETHSLRRLPMQSEHRTWRSPAAGQAPARRTRPGKHRSRTPQGGRPTRARDSKADDSAPFCSSSSAFVTAATNTPPTGNQTAKAARWPPPDASATAPPERSTQPGTRSAANDVHDGAFRGPGGQPRFDRRRLGSPTGTWKQPCRSTSVRSYVPRAGLEPARSRSSGF